MSNYVNYRIANRYDAAKAMFEEYVGVFGKRGVHYAYFANIGEKTFFGNLSRQDRLADVAYEVTVRFPKGRGTGGSLSRRRLYAAAHYVWSMRSIGIWTITRSNAMMFHAGSYAVNETKFRRLSDAAIVVLGQLSIETGVEIDANIALELQQVGVCSIGEDDMWRLSDRFSKADIDLFLVKRNEHKKAQIAEKCFDVVKRIAELGKLDDISIANYDIHDVIEWAKDALGE